MLHSPDYSEVRCARRLMVYVQCGGMQGNTGAAEKRQDSEERLHGGYDGVVYRERCQARRLFPK